jgi:hypothetical protein
MKTVTEILIHPYIGNDNRPEVVDWCTKQFGVVNSEQRRWVSTSNYTRSKEGTFDVFFKNLKDAQWFLLKWGGDIIYTKTEGSEVDPEVFQRLFEIA